MTDETKSAILHHGRFGEFSVSGFLVQGNGACGKDRRGWVLTFKESAASHHPDREHRYWVCEEGFREVLDGDLREGLSGTSSFHFKEKIADVPKAVRQAALEAIALWESGLPPIEERCQSRCTAANKMGTDFCTVF